MQNIRPRAADKPRELKTSSEMIKATTNQQPEMPYIRVWVVDRHDPALFSSRTYLIARVASVVPPQCAVTLGTPKTARMNGFVSCSSSIVLGTVNADDVLHDFAHASLSWIILFFGST